MELKIKIGKRGIIAGLILIILLAVYNIIYFVVPLDRSLSDGAFWVTYAFTTFFILFMAAVVFLGLRGKETKSKVFGVPILRLGYATLVIQLVIDGIVMGVGHFFEIQTWIPIIVEVVLLAFFFISLIARTAYKEFIQEIDAQGSKTAFIKEFRVNVGTFYESLPEGEFKKEFESVNELVKYADPVSNKSVVEIEDAMVAEFEEIKKAFGLGDLGEARSHSEKLGSLIGERKMRLKQE